MLLFQAQTKDLLSCLHEHLEIKAEMLSNIHLIISTPRVFSLRMFENDGGVHTFPTENLLPH